VAITLESATVDAERQAAGGALSTMKTVGRRVEDAAARIDRADNPINFMVSLSSTLQSLEKFNLVLDKIAMVRTYAMHFSTDSSNYQIHPYAQAAWTVLSFVSKVLLSHTFQ
jgi:hypothetical protein